LLAALRSQFEELVGRFRPQIGMSESHLRKTTGQQKPANWNKFCRRVVSTLTFIGLLLAPPAYSQFVLQLVPGLPPVSAGSVAWGDFDNDGQLDFVLSGSLTVSLWHNTGNGFSNVTASVAPTLPGLYDSSVAWGDFDNDGRLDLLITGLTNFSGGAVSQVWRNTGTAFTNVPIPGLVGVGESSAAWCDFDGDGRLDFLISGTSNGISSGAISQLWRNTGTGFTNVPIPALPGAYFGSIAWGDFDNDGRPDFLISGITNSNTGDSICQLWRNTGSGFTNVPVAGLRGMFDTSIAWADFDNDGLLDFMLEGLSGNTFVSELWRSTATGFTRVPIPGLPGVADGSLAWGDFDNDGRPDFLITGLTNGSTKVSQVWQNSGSGFTNLPFPALPGNFDNSLAVGDFDNDNRLDFLIAGTIEGGFVSELWRNTTFVSNAPPGP
jgi:FG-GAP-like repeat